jgi:hypothetical protein
MKWLLVSPKDRQRARASVAIGVGAFLAAALAGSLPVAPGQVVWGTTGFIAFVLGLRKALVLWRVDEMVFDHRPPWNAVPRERPAPAKPVTLGLRRARLARIVSFAILGAAATASSAGAQQTIFNVPTADVLDKGKLYFETDWLWRPNPPSFATGAPLRGVYGFGGNVEGGVNFAGINTPGSSVPTASPAIKWQPYTSDAFTVTTGAFGLFFLRGSRDGSPAGMVYAHAASKLPTGTRLSAGGWWASSGYAAPGAVAGGLFGLEQTITSNLTVAADWYTGNNSLGYLTPGVVVTAGRWVLYAGYSIKNGNSKGDGLLLELGFNIP